MSGIVQNNILRSSGTVAVSAAGLNWSDTIITGSTATVEAGNGYWVNTTSNTCTITLPSSAEKGDQIVIIDYARTWGTNKIIIDSNGLNYQGNDDTYTVEYTTDGQSVNIVYSDATKGWLPLEDDVTADVPVAPPTQKAIIGYGRVGSTKVSTSNLVNSSGVVASDTTGVGTERRIPGAVSYGGDKAIFAYGLTSSAVSMSNLVNNSGVVGNDVSGVGTARSGLATTTFGTTGQALFAYGEIGGGSGRTNISNKVNNSGVIASDTTGVGTSRSSLAGNAYGVGLGIFAYGTISAGNVSNLVSNTGVVATDVTGVGTAREAPGAAGYGTGLALFAYGEASGSNFLNESNKVSFTGVVASDTTGVGTERYQVSAASYGGDKAIFFGGDDGAGTRLGMTNLVSNTGVVASDVSAVATAREGSAASGYSYSA